MEGSQLKVGDRVYDHEKEDTGVIVHIEDFGVLVEHDTWRGGHDGNASTYRHRPIMKNSGWWVSGSTLKKITTDEPTPQTLIITHTVKSPVLPTDSGERKAIPVVRGVLDYFPAALAEVAKVSKAGNDQHHPGEPLYWERGKSTDHADTIVRHLMERGTVDTDGMRHSAKVAWRALALLQEELEAEGAPKARGSR